jgi:hypothetical protein
MNPADSSELTAQTLLDLRQEDDALKLITEKLRVKEMGPADHIRTKHEVKVFVESGDLSMAKVLIRQAQERASEQQKVTIRLSEQQKRGQQMGI